MFMAMSRRTIAVLIASVGVIPLSARADFLGDLSNTAKRDASIRANQQINQMIPISVAHVSGLPQTGYGLGQCHAAGSLAGVSIPSIFQINPTQVLSNIATSTVTDSVSSAATDAITRSGVGNISGGLGTPGQLGSRIGVATSNVLTRTISPPATSAPTTLSNSPAPTTTPSPGTAPTPSSAAQSLSTIWAPVQQH
jgi:hypothetical protein